MTYYYKVVTAFSAGWHVFIYLVVLTGWQLVNLHSRNIKQKNNLAQTCLYLEKITAHCQITFGLNFYDNFRFGIYYYSCKIAFVHFEKWPTKKSNNSNNKVFSIFMYFFFKKAWFMVNRYANLFYLVYWKQHLRIYNIKVQPFFSFLDFVFKRNVEGLVEDITSHFTSLHIL